MVDHVAIAGEGFQPQQAGISGHSVPALWLTIEEPPWLGRFFNPGIQRINASRSLHPSLHRLPALAKIKASSNALLKS